jgi:hypothetical protein
MRAMSRYLFLICIVFASYCNAQSADSIKPVPVPSSTDTNVRVIANSSVTGTIQKVQQYEQMSHGTSPGFRIQVHFGSDRNGANSAKTDFMLKYPGYSTYLTYQQPYFKVCIGDFRTKLEAVSVLGKVKKDYPGAFVVRDKINPPALH